MIYCRHNAKIYEVHGRIDCVCDDSYRILRPNKRLGHIQSSRILRPILSTSNEHNDSDSIEKDDSKASITRHVRFTDEDDTCDDNDEPAVDIMDESNGTKAEELKEQTQMLGNDDITPVNDDPSSISHDSNDCDMNTNTSDKNTVQQPYFDIIVCSPPWGGPDYLQVDKYDLSKVPSGDVCELIDLASQITPNIILIIPKNCTKKGIEEIGKKLQLKCCIEDICLHGRLKMKIVYFGDILSTKVEVLM